MAQFDAPTAYDARRVIDLVDVDSQKWAEYAERQPLADAWSMRARGARCCASSARWRDRMDASVLVSAAEAALFADLAPEAAHKIDAVNNGVDTDYFSPGRTYETPFPRQSNAGRLHRGDGLLAEYRRGAVLRPQRLAVAARGLPGRHLLDRRLQPGARGARPRPLPGVVVTGRVPDVRPYLAHAAAVVAPLRLARGIQNKVLEAMAMARPVVATPQAAEGIDAVAGQRPPGRRHPGRHGQAPDRDRPRRRPSRPWIARAAVTFWQPMIGKKAFISWMLSSMVAPGQGSGLAARPALRPTVRSERERR